jgi:uncharacterized phiE125 gp8 family phage protein
MYLKLITPPVIPVLTKADIEMHARLNAGEDDPILLDSIIKAATSRAQDFMCRALSPQTWCMTLEDFPGLVSSIALPYPPITAIDSIKYYDTAGVQQTLSSTKYVLELGEPAYITPARSAYLWPSTDAYRMNTVEIQFQCGYATEASIPEEIKRGICFLVSQMYDNRETFEVSQAFEFMLAAYKVYGLDWSERK